MCIDFYKLDALAPGAAGQATRLARPSNKEMSGTVTGKPEQENGKWAPDACAYCHYRPLAAADCPEANRWWHGTGDGAHSPYRCQAAKRYLCEGGDREKHPEYVDHLRATLRFAKVWQRQ